MIPASHTLAASLIFDNLDKTININKNKFCYGSVLPDFSPTYAFIPHYKEDSLAFIISSIKTVKCALDKRALSADVLSLQLGIITHYLMDFFCYAHNDKHMDQLPHHFFYELNLHHHFKRLLRDTATSTISDVFSSNIPNLYVSDYIEYTHKEYLNSISGANNDIKFSLKVAYSIVASMISTCTNSLIFKAA
jgi:hypothetical protein